MDGAVKAVRSGGVEQASVRPRIELRDVAGPVALECCVPARRIVPGDIVRNQRVVPPRYCRSNRYSSRRRRKTAGKEAERGNGAGSAATTTAAAPGSGRATA